MVKAIKKKDKSTELFYGFFSLYCTQAGRRWALRRDPAALPRPWRPPDHGNGRRRRRSLGCPSAAEDGGLPLASEPGSLRRRWDAIGRGGRVPFPAEGASLRCRTRSGGERAPRREWDVGGGRGSSNGNRPAGASPTGDRGREGGRGAPSFSAARAAVSPASREPASGKGSQRLAAPPTPHPTPRQLPRAGGGRRRRRQRNRAGVFSARHGLVTQLPGDHKLQPWYN